MLRHFITPSSDPESGVIHTTGYLLNISTYISPTVPVLIPPSTMGEYDAKAEAIEDAVSRSHYLELFGPLYKVVPVLAQDPILIPSGKKVLRLVRHEYKPTAETPIAICFGVYHKDMERFTDVKSEARLSEEGSFIPGDAVPIDIGDWTFDPFVHKFPVSGWEYTAANGVRYTELDVTDAQQCWTSHAYISGRVCDQRMRDALRPKSTVSVYNGEWVTLQKPTHLSPTHAIIFWSDSGANPLISSSESLSTAECTDVAIIEHVDACYHPVPTNPTFVDFWGRTYSNVTGTLDPASVTHIDQVTELVLDKLRHLPLSTLQRFLSYVPIGVRNQLPASPYREADAACIHHLTEVLRIELTLNVAHKTLNALGVQQ